MKNSSLEYFTHFLKTDSGANLLRAKSAAFVITFLYNEFRVDHVPFILADDFESHLVSFLQNNVIDVETLLISEEEAPQEVLLGDIQAKAKFLVSYWCSENKNYIKRYYSHNKNFVIELHASIERLFTWLESCEPEEFVGTESRFQDILFQLRNLKTNMDQNPELRIAELKKEKKRIDDEIQRIKESGRAETFTPVQIQERLLNISRSSRELLGDFRQVGENFKQILNDIYREQTETNATKGEILGYTLDTNRQLKLSPQGQSFSTFWKFISQDSDNEINTLIESIIISQADRGLVYSDVFLSRLKHYLYQEGHKIIEQNRQLTDKINRVLSRQEQDEYQRVKELSNEIKSLVKALFSKEKKLPEQCAMEIEGKAEIYAPQARYPVLKSEETIFTEMESFNSRQINQEALKDVFNQFYIDEKLLLSYADEFRKKMNGKQFTLAEMLISYPIEKGLAEIITWFSIAENDTRIIIQKEKNDSIEYNKNGDLIKVKLPRMVFS